MIRVRARFFYEAKNFTRANETPREVASRTQDPGTLILELDLIQRE